MSSDIEHWYINATVYKDRVEEIHLISDPTRNVRRRPHTKVWQVGKSLGRGGFGEVHLEWNKEDGKTRAVKRIPTTSTMLSSSECEKELKALLEFSKPKVSRNRTLVLLVPSLTSCSPEKLRCLSTSLAGSRMAPTCFSQWNTSHLEIWKEMCQKILGKYQ